MTPFAREKTRMTKPESLNDESVTWSGIDSDFEATGSGAGEVNDGVVSR